MNPLANSEKIELPEVVAPPNYSTLLEWWNEWPEARPAHLDFWARGNFTRRLLSRPRCQRGACIVRAEYLDEIDAALTRLALLDLEIDFVWHGEVSGPQLVIVPQHVDYEDTGGWGYNACAGDEIKDRRGGKEWCPSMGWASLLPNTMTDGLATEAAGFVRSGRIMVAPVDHVGLQKLPGGNTEEQLQRLSRSMSLMGDRARSKRCSSFSFHLCRECRYEISRNSAMITETRSSSFSAHCERLFRVLLANPRMLWQRNSFKE
jgi:hypothetical protein